MEPTTLITGGRMAAVDENAEALADVPGVARKQPMESSGHAVARAVRDVAEPGSSVAVVASHGNDGMSGVSVPLVVARIN